MSYFTSQPPLGARKTGFFSVVESRASCVMRAQSPVATASLGKIHEPPTHSTLDRARSSGAFCSVTPPVGQNDTAIVVGQA